MADMMNHPDGEVEPGGVVMTTRRAHSERFRTVSNRYPRRVAEAYGGDLEHAMSDSDERVAAQVAAWERSHGLRPRDWRGRGIAEGREEES
jgi:hypothetical protein